MQDLDSIYREHAKTVYKFLYSKTQNGDWAEELTQETFYRAMYSLDTFNGTCKISTWLCQIAKHIWMQEIEKRAKYLTTELKDELPAGAVSVIDQLVATEQKIDLLKALHLVKDPMREVLYLRLFGDLSFKEIGEIMEQSETWARVTFYRGKKMIVEVLL